MKKNENAEKVNPGEEPPIDTKTKERVRRLKWKAMSGIEAWRCCVGSKRQAQKLLFDMGNACIEAFQNRPREALVAPLGPSVVTRIGLKMAVPQTTKLMVGIATVYGASQLGMGLNTAAEAQAIKQFVDIATDVINKTEEDCLRCVERKVFGQKKKRARGVWQPTRSPNAKKVPVLKPNRMRIRIAHR